VIFATISELWLFGVANSAHPIVAGVPRLEEADVIHRHISSLLPYPLTVHPTSPLDSFSLFKHCHWHPCRTLLITPKYSSMDTVEDQLYALSTYAESSILEKSIQHERLLIALANLDHAPTAYRETVSRLSTLKDCLATHQSLLDSVRRDASAKRRKAENGQHLSAKKALLRAAKGKTRTVEHAQETEHDLIEAMRKEREEQMIVQVMQTEIKNVSAEVRQGALIECIGHTDTLPSCRHRFRCSKVLPRSMIPSSRIWTTYTRTSLPVLVGALRPPRRQSSSPIRAPAPEFPEEDDAELEVIALEKLQKEVRADFHLPFTSVWLISDNFEE